MKRHKVIEVIRMLQKDGWVLCYTKGDHRQFKHPEKKGKVTVRGKEKRDTRPVQPQQHLEIGGVEMTASPPA